MLKKDGNKIKREHTSVIFPLKNTLGTSQSSRKFKTSQESNTPGRLVEYVLVKTSLSGGFVDVVVWTQTEFKISHMRCCYFNFHLEERK